MIYLTDAPKWYSGRWCTKALGLEFLWLEGLKLRKGVQRVKSCHLDMLSPHDFHIQHADYFTIRKQTFLFFWFHKGSPYLNAPGGKKNAKRRGTHGWTHQTSAKPDPLPFHYGPAGHSAAQRLFCHPLSALRSVSRMWEACMRSKHWPDNCCWAIDKQKGGEKKEALSNEID